MKIKEKTFKSKGIPGILIDEYGDATGADKQPDGHYNTGCYQCGGHVVRDKESFGSMRADYFIKFIPMSEIFQNDDDIEV